MTLPTGHSIPQMQPPLSPRETLPTMYDLPSEFPEEPGLPDEFHDYQPQLLSRTLSLDVCAADNRFTGTDINVYYDVHHPLWHKRPDWFLALNVPRLYDGHDLRQSYVVWQEGQAPTIVVEFLSPKTEKEDLGRFYRESDLIEDSSPDPVEASQNGSKQKPPAKFIVYERYLRVPHYLVYSRYTKRLRYFKLVGVRYEEQTVQSETPMIWFEDLNIGLGLWEGYFEGLPESWLRWCDAHGNWYFTDTEKAEADKAQAEADKAQAEADKAQAEADKAQAEAEKLTRHKQKLTRHKQKLTRHKYNSKLSVLLSVSESWASIQSPSKCSNHANQSTACMSVLASRRSCLEMRNNS